MAEKSYAGRNVLDKLGIDEGTRVAAEGPVPPDLLERATERGAELVPATDSDPVDVVLHRLADLDAAGDALTRLRDRIDPAGGIWILTAKRGRPDYVKQTDLIPVGKAAGLVDNKVCSVDEATSAMRFVIPRELRGPRNRPPAH